MPEAPVCTVPLDEARIPCRPEDKVGFILASTHQGTFILNRFDCLVWERDGKSNVAGIGAYLLETGRYDGDESELSCKLLSLRRQYHGDGVFVLDVGANIGVFSVAWARYMAGWGNLLAMEPQERIYYALCGNIALNNCWNAQAWQVAVSDGNGAINFTAPDYTQWATFGGFDIKGNHCPGQTLDQDNKSSRVQCMTIDSLKLCRLDFLKIDVETMELEVLRGAMDTIERCKPIISVEVMLDREHYIQAQLEEFGYLPSWGENTRQLICIHPADPVRAATASLRG